MLICFVINNRDKEILLGFGKHLKQVRIKKGLSQHQLAYEANINKNQVGNIERGEVNPTLTTLISISKVLDIEFNELLDFKN